MKEKKNISISMLIWGAVSLSLGIYMDKKRLEKSAEKEKMLAKGWADLDAYEQWVEAFLNGKKIPEYLLQNNYHNVAIYGFGRLGKQLYRELFFSDVHVAYIIDLSFERGKKSFDGIPCFHPEEDLPEAELIIVTIPSGAKEIMTNLRNKVQCQIKSIYDLLFVM